MPESADTPTPDETLPSSSDGGSEKRSRPRLLLIVIALIGGSGFFLLQHQQGGQSQRGAGQGAAVPVTVAMAQKGNIGVFIYALGYVTPVNTVTVRSRVDGALLKVNFREGQMVRAGEVLAEIDLRTYQAQLTQAEGQYDRDKALLDEACIDLNRYREAYAGNAISRQQLDIQQATVYQDEGTVKIGRGQVENAKVNLSYCTISSPITGRVGLRLVDPGNIVHASDAGGLLVITQIQPITVVFSVAQDALPQIQGQIRAGHRLAVDALDRTQQMVASVQLVLAVGGGWDASQLPTPRQIVVKP